MTTQRRTLPLDTHLLANFDSNDLLNPPPPRFSEGGAHGGQSAPFMQHSLLNFFSEFDHIITQELTATRRDTPSVRRR